MRILAMRPIHAVCFIAFAAPVSLSLKAQSMPPITPPRLISIPKPDCRSGKACHGSHGQVRLVLDVLEDGKVGDIRVELGKATLADAATEVAQQAEFVPGSFLGKPQSMNFVLNLSF
jgi:Gram-negative bacterial TonB protein C-terminal